MMKALKGDIVLIYIMIHTDNNEDQLLACGTSVLQNAKKSGLNTQSSASVLLC